MKASFDKTYCVSKKCKNKCWRHESKWEFEKEGYYWFIDKCEEEKMIINLRKMSLETKISMVLLAVVSLMLIGLSIIAKEILGVLSGVIFWIIIIDMIVVEAQNQHIQMLDLLCDVQQEILAEKFGCTRAEIDIMCTERLMKRNEKSR